jgi:hypothetical protein
MEKQTAVRYAQELINIILYYLDDDELERINDVFEYAKEMEKQQIKDAWNNGFREFYDGSSTPRNITKKLMRQSSIDLLVQKLAENGIIHSFDINEVKEIHKQEIMNAYETSHISMMTSKQYYNETFKSTFPISDNEYKKVIKALYPKDNSRTFKSE